MSHVGVLSGFLKVPLELVCFILFYNLLELNDTLINCLG